MFYFIHYILLYIVFTKDLLSVVNYSRDNGVCNGTFQYLNMKLP